MHVDNFLSSTLSTFIYVESGDVSYVIQFLLALRMVVTVRLLVSPASPFTRARLAGETIRLIIFNKHYEIYGPAPCTCQESPLCISSSSIYIQDTSSSVATYTYHFSILHQPSRNSRAKIANQCLGLLPGRVPLMTTPKYAGESRLGGALESWRRSGDRWKKRVISNSAILWLH